MITIPKKIIFIDNTVTLKQPNSKIKLRIVTLLLVFHISI